MISTVSQQEEEAFKGLYRLTQKKDKTIVELYIYIIVFKSNINKQLEENYIYTLNKALRDYKTKKQLYTILCSKPIKTIEQQLSIKVKAKKITYPNTTQGQRRSSLNPL